MASYFWCSGLARRRRRRSTSLSKPKGRKRQEGKEEVKKLSKYMFKTIYLGGKDVGDRHWSVYHLLASLLCNGCDRPTMPGLH